MPLWIEEYVVWRAYMDVAAATLWILVVLVAVYFFARTDGEPRRQRRPRR